MEYLNMPDRHAAAPIPLRALEVLSHGSHLQLFLRSGAFVQRVSKTFVFPQPI